MYDILLKQYDIQPEMASYSYVTLMTSMADKQEYYDRLLAALSDIDAKLAARKNGIGQAYTAGAKPLQNRDMPHNEIKLTPYDAVNSDCVEVPFSECEGRISAATVCMYPPGIPLICPGEVIGKAAVAAIGDALRQGFEIMGLSEDNERNERKILCLR